MEEALYDTPLYREFAGLDMGEEHLPDESTILRFRHLLERHNLNMQILASINATLTAKGLLLKQGTAIDATLIAAPSSTKNSSGERDPEMHQTKKGTPYALLSYLTELIPGLQVIGAKQLPSGTHRGGLVQLKQLCQLATVRTKRPPIADF